MIQKHCDSDWLAQLNRHNEEGFAADERVWNAAFFKKGEVLEIKQQTGAICEQFKVRLSNHQHDTF